MSTLSSQTKVDKRSTKVDAEAAEGPEIWGSQLIDWLLIQSSAKKYRKLVCME